MRYNNFAALLWFCLVMVEIIVNILTATSHVVEQQRERHVAEKTALAMSARSRHATTINRYDCGRGTIVADRIRH